MNKRDKEELKWAVVMISIAIGYWIFYVLFIGWRKHFFCPHHWEGDILDFYNENELPYRLRDAVLSNNLDEDTRVKYVTKANFLTVNETTKVYSPNYNATYCGWRGEIKKHE